MLGDRPWAVVIPLAGPVDHSSRLTARPTPRISCEARLNEEEATLDTYLQDLRASSAASACWAAALSRPLIMRIGILGAFGEKAQFLDVRVFPPPASDIHQ